MPVRVARPVLRVRERLGAELVAELIRDYQAGWSVKLVGQRYGISKPSVLKLLAEDGVPTRKSGVNYDFLPPATRQREATWAWKGRADLDGHVLD